MSLLYQIIAAFGGGVFGALIGGTNAFIFTGITGLAGVVLLLSGNGDILISSVAGGPYLAPHVGFAGGVAALAIINKHKDKFIDQYKNIEDYEHTKEMKVKLESYRDIDGLSTFTPLYSFSNIQAILVGGLFGAGGYFLNYYFAEIFNLPVDTVALTIVISNLLVRIFIGKGTINKFEGGSFYDQVNSNILFNMAWAIPFSIVASYVTFTMGNELIVFYISAFSLILNSIGESIPVTHHISLTAAYATLAFNNIWIGMLVGLLAMLIGEYFDVTVNKHAETLIDMPSFVIALLSFIIFIIS